jgi:hypothetical protein
LFLQGTTKLTFNKKLIIPLAALATIAIVLTAVTAAVLTTQQNVPSNGTIQNTPNTTAKPASSGNSGGTNNPITSTINLDIYTDAAATTKLSSLQWGTLNPGGTVTKTIYIKNSGNTSERLNMTATEWAPVAASQVLTLTWNKEGSTLAAGAVVSATLTLRVAADPGDVSNFSMNIVINGSA